MATTISRTKRRSRARWTAKRRTTSGVNAAASISTSTSRARPCPTVADAEDAVVADSDASNALASTSSLSDTLTGRAVVTSTANADAARPPRETTRPTRGSPSPLALAQPSSSSPIESRPPLTNSPQFGPFYVGWQDGQGEYSLSNSWCCSAVKLAHERIIASRRGVASKSSFERYPSSTCSSTLSDRDDSLSSRSHSPFSSSTSMSSSCTCPEEACTCFSDDYYSSIPEYSRNSRISSSFTSPTSIEQTRLAENSASDSLMVVPLTPTMPLLDRVERIWDGHRLPSHILLPSAWIPKSDPDASEIFTKSGNEMKMVRDEIEERSQSLLETDASVDPIAPTMSHWLNEDAWE
ncbi:BQ2448_6399 [Microbotryum intermedium]|uniref:BQ2448_6399 protein n=1 Tax=Microbotryum intermedium TaxID=269621 RepID=A0A238FMF4_9BASI|nr:BQ2448_6399 [Microbotryum intermedium]